MNAVQQIHSSENFPALHSPVTLPDLSTASKLSTGSAPLERLLGGGLPRGETVEVYGQRSGGRFSMALTALAMATARGRSAALVDLGDCLDPQSAAAAGVDLGRLLWVRPRRLDQALASTEAIIGSGIPLVVIDLGIPPIPGGHGDQQAWRRLILAAREHRVALWISSPFRITGDAANTVIEAFQPSVSWRRQGETSRILGGLSSHLELRSTGGGGASQETGPQRLSLGTSDTLAEDAGDDVRILEFPARERDLPRYRAIA
ncbi:MAG: hypothetical protein V3T72_22895 [Thermoanaerobaculia bacterium]